MSIHIGTSGWSYDHWQGVLYAPDLPARDRLGIYTQHFETVELNSSYYRWPSDAAFKSWQRRLPKHFLMSVKAPRELTHFKRLYQPEKWLATIARGLNYLKQKRGILLVQMGREVFVYFNNDGEGNAVRNAFSLRGML